MTHRYHPDHRTGEAEAVLYPDCDRCIAHANHPLSSLDSQHLRTLAVMADEATWTNEIERVACMNLAGGLAAQYGVMALLVEVGRGSVTPER